MRTWEPATSRGIDASVRAVAWGRLADYLELTKPRIAVLVLVTVTVGFVLGSSGRWGAERLLHSLVGIALVACGSSALNQLIERRTDARMQRTADRPLPAGRLLPAEVLIFGLGTAALGIVELALFVNPLTALLALATFLLYVAVYTPLKRKTPFATAIGAIPGALPPVLGWTAATGRLGAEALALFAILFLWQFPHFMAIAWLYREDYRNSGLKMIPGGGWTRGTTGTLCAAYALCLIPVSLLPSHLALAGGGYELAALVLGAGYLLCAVRFLWQENAASARGLLLSSLIYLPMLLFALTWNHFALLQ